MGLALLQCKFWVETVFAVQFVAVGGQSGQGKVDVTLEKLRLRDED